MEEDIKILEEFLKEAKMFGIFPDYVTISKTQLQAIENLIARNKYLEENRIWSEATLEGLKKDFIPKSKVKEKIKKYEWAIEHYDCDEADYRQSQDVGSWHALQELLED